MNSLFNKLSISLKNRPSFNPHSESLLILFRQITNTSTTDQPHLVKSICDSLRLGSSWNVLSDKFSNLVLHENLVRQVMLELKRPIDAKRALGFFHWASKRKGIEHGLGSYSIAIHVTVKAHLESDAKALIFSVLSKRKVSEFDSDKLSVVESLLGSFWVTGSDPSVFDLLVCCYSKLRMFQAGFEVCCHLSKKGFNISLLSFNTMLHYIKRSENCGLAWEVYEHMVWARVYPNKKSVEILIECLCKEGNLIKRVEALDRICGKRVSNPKVIVNTSLVLRVLEQKGRAEEGIELLKRMLMKNMVFDAIAHSLIIFAKIKNGESERAREVFDEMLKRGFRPNSFVHTTLIGACCEEGKLDEARSLVLEMERLGLELYDDTMGFLVEGFARAGKSKESARIFNRMVEKRFVPSVSAFNAMIGALCRDGRVKKANSALSAALEIGFLTDEATYGILIDGFGKIGDSHAIRKLYYEMETKSIPLGPSVFSNLVKSLCLNGEFHEAEKFLWTMRLRCSDAVDCRKSLYELLISCSAEKGYIEKADKIRRRIALEVGKYW